jgi:2',3'-cyclic-nucleotide 2'-phosphodiesterase (5'-nucleotidase family)
MLSYVRRWQIIVTLVVVISTLSVAAAGAGAVTTQSNHTTQVVSIQEIQTPANSSGDSPYAGQNVTTEGTVTAVAEEGYYIQNGTGGFSGVFVLTGSSPSVSPGDVVNLTAPVEEEFGLTRLNLDQAGASVTVTGSESVPEAIALDTEAVSQEDYEGVLVNVSEADVPTTPGEFGEWDIDDGSGQANIDDVDTGASATPDEAGGTVDYVVGPVFYSFSEFKIQPKTIDDLEPPAQTVPGEYNTDGNYDPNGTTISLLTYNDIQTAAAKDGNFSRMIELISQRRAAIDDPVYVAGAGDQIGPHALSPISQWRAPVDVLNAVTPDADVIGNHEFDYGLDPISNVTAASEFPWLASNLLNASTNESFDGTEKYEIVERNGVRVGYIGLIDQGATFGKTNIPFNEEGLAVQDVSTVGPQVADQLKTQENVDVVVALAHTGIGDAQAVAQADDGDIDVIAVGDDEQYYPPQETSDTIITESRARSLYLGELNMTVNTTANEVTGWEGTLRAVGPTERNETASEIINGYRAEISLDQNITQATVPLDARFATNYHRESRYGNLVTDAFRETTGAQVAITNAGGIRSDAIYGPGNITGGDVFNTLPFTNTVVKLEVTGATLREALASQLVTLESSPGQEFGAEISQQTSGVSFEWVPHESADQQIRDLTVNGEPVESGEAYTVAVNSFMAGGGSSYPFENATVLNETGVLYAESVISHMEDRDTVSPEIEGRMRRVDATVGPVDHAVDPDADRTTVSMSVPDRVQVMNTSSVHLLDSDGNRVDAVSATHDPESDTVSATFRIDDVLSLGENVDLYAAYNDGQFAGDRVYFENSVLNADLNVTRESDEGTATPTATPTTTETQSDAESIVPQPGFGIEVTALALVAVWLLLYRRIE